jgi:predicted  nucleic acid-binding Zn-ribbon protein
MIPEIENLLILQDRDQRIRSLRSELSAIPGERKVKEKLIQDSAARLEASKSRLREIEVERKRLELEAASKREQILRYKTQQMQTKKNEEYAAFNHEIASAETLIRQIEDKELDLMAETESLAPATEASEKLHAEEKLRFQTQIADLEAKTGTLEKMVAELESTRPPLTEPLDPDLLDRYQRLFKSKNGVVVVPLEHDVCTGCHMKVPTQTSLEVRGEKVLVDCPNCGRILHLPV